VGTSTLTHDNGKLNIKRIEELVRVLSDIKNSGKSVILVSSGAIGVGASRMGFSQSPSEVKEKQALSSVGQCQLMSIYDECFRRYNHIVGQVLLTKDVITNEKMLENAINTFNVLMEYGVIPIVNENDAISTNEILFGDNDTLSAYVANIVEADLLVILTDIDGLYDKNPQEPTAQLLSLVEEITEEIRNNAGGAGSERGTGGMSTKVLAAEIAAKSKTKTLIINGADPSLIYQALGGEEIGTFFNL
jgi:glutamate 5-kinase